MPSGHLSSAARSFRLDTMAFTDSGKLSTAHETALTGTNWGTTCSSEMINLALLGVGNIIGVTGAALGYLSERRAGKV